MLIVVIVMSLERYVLKAVIDRLHPFSAVALEVLLVMSIGMYLLFGFMKSLLFVSRISSLACPVFHLNVEI